MIVNSNDKKRARLNLARDLLSKIDYEGKDQTAVCLLPDPSIVWMYSQHQTQSDPCKEIQKQIKELKERKEKEKKLKKAQEKEREREEKVAKKTKNKSLQPTKINTPNEKKETTSQNKI